MLARRNPDHRVVSAPTEICVEIVDASQLCGEIAARWTEIRQQNSQLASPYFDVEFTKAVAQVRDDVEIAIVKNSDEKIVGLVPYQRTGLNHAEPVGGRLNDVHGMVANSDADQLDILTKVMHAAELRSFGFHAALKNDPKLERFEFCELDSHYVDIRNGWDDYQQWSRSKTKVLRRQGQKTRALEREIGPIRFEFDCSDAECLEKLIELKRAKYQRSNTFDILSVNWASNLIREISNVDKPDFKGLLSSLYAGDQLVAAHFGMLTNDILHYWFPVFDPRFAKYSPGTELLIRVMQESCLRKIAKIDLGYGDDAYKHKFCNGRESVSCGKVVFNRMSFGLAKQQYEIRQRLKGIPMKPLAKSMLRGMFPGFGKWNFR